MKEKIRIQILDIVQDPVEPNRVDVTLGAPTGVANTSTNVYPFTNNQTTAGPPWSIYVINDSLIGNTGAWPQRTTTDPHYLEHILSDPLVLGESYDLSFELKGMNNSGTGGYLGFDTQGGVSASAKLNVNGVYSETFIATAQQLRLYCNKVQLSSAAGWVKNGAFIQNIRVAKSTITTTNNVVGELDITDSDDFPLALSYAVSDGKDLEQRFGDYSKTFDVPATKNNNRLLADNYDVKIIDRKDMTGLKPCRILVGDTEFFRGLIQVGGSTQAKKPQSYTCTIYGGNFAWIAQLKTFNLCDVYDLTYSFTYNYSNIASSFNDTYANSEIVYPLISYGDFWPNPGANIYGAGYVNLGDSTDPSQDWRPSFWVYNILQKIFNNIGYSISSNFIEGSEFKKLICHFPPTGEITDTQGSMFVTRRYWNQDSPSGGGGYGIWDSNVTSKDFQIVQPCDGTWITGAQGANLGDTTWQDIKHDDVIDDPNSCYDSTTGYWTCPKAGLYNFSSAVHLVIGNFDNTQASDGVISTYAGVDNLEVGIRIVMEDASGTYQVGAFDNFNTAQTILNTNQIKMQAGAYTTQASSPAPYTSMKIPVLVGVEKTMQNPYAWWVPQGYKVKVQVQVRWETVNNSSCGSYGMCDPTNAKIGYVSLSDESRNAFTGGNGVHFFGGKSFYANTEDGFIGNTNSSIDIGSVKHIWSRNSKPFFRVEPVPNEGFNIGSQYLLSDVLPCDITQTNFIKGIAHLFNLQFRTDSQSKTVYIEPFDDFFGEKVDAVDWSNKLDYSKEISDSFKVGLNEEMSWEYKNDGSDAIMKFVNEKFKEEDSAYHFFNHLEDVGERYTKGLKRFTNPVFASTWTDWNADAGGGGGVHPKLMPVINKAVSIYGYGVQANPSRPDKTTKYAPRIMKYNGDVLGPNHSNFLTSWNFKHIVGGTLTPQGDGYSPRAMFVDWEDTSGDLFSNLSFDNEIITPPQTSVFFENPGLYELFWKNMIEQYKANPRIRTAYFRLTMSDMILIDLRKLVYIDGSYWRVNKIIDYSPAKNELTKVELVQWTEQIPLPDRKRPPQGG
jgi:hypothetical protein